MDSSDANLAKTPAQALQIIRSLFGNKVPVLPNHNARADRDDQIRKLLGSEHPIVVVDGSLDWPTDELAAAAGAVSTPGLLLILLPQGLAVSSEASSSYERYLKSALGRSMRSQPLTGVWALVSNRPPMTVNPVLCGPPQWAAEQRAVLQAIVARCALPTPSLDVLIAKRGRGKSVVLGEILRTLHRQGTHSLTLSATHPNQVLTALRRANSATITFTPLDQVLQGTGQVLVVDEAGSVPLPVLKQLAQQYQHVVLAGTVEGYEGSGRALALRLNDMALNIQHHHLHRPIRWPEGDAVEALLSDVFRHEQKTLGKTLENTHDFVSFNIKDIKHAPLSPQQLLSDSSLMEAIFGLLLQAHYQTTTHDLRLLIDQPGLTLWGQWCNGLLTAACLVAHEGGLSDALVQAINQGDRRPAHQRLPMLLHRQSGADEVLQQPAWRIVRIAVRAELRRKGLGSRFLKHLIQSAAQTNSSDNPAPAFIGAAFGATPIGLKFWQGAGFQSIHFGFRLNPRSGQRSVAVAMACKNTLENASYVRSAHDQLLDSLNAMNELDRAQSPLLHHLYGARGLQRPVLQALLAPSTAASTASRNTSPSAAASGGENTRAGDRERLRQWQQGKLQLHDVWGPVLRAVGGSDGLATVQIPADYSAKRTAKVVLQHVVAGLAAKE